MLWDKETDRVLAPCQVVVALEAAERQREANATSCRELLCAVRQRADAAVLSAQSAAARSSCEIFLSTINLNYIEHRLN